MPTVFTVDDEHTFDSVVIKSNAWVVGIDEAEGGTHKHSFPPSRILEVEGDVAYER